MLLKLSEEYALFYMYLELTMNAVVEISGIGGSIVNWKFVGPTACFCLGSIFVRGSCHSSESSDGERRRGRNGANHHDGNDGVLPIGARVVSQPPAGVGVEMQPIGVELIHDEENQQGGGLDAAEDGRETNDQGHRRDLGSGSEIASGDEGDEDDDNDDDDYDNDGLELVSDELRQTNMELNQEGDGDDGAEGGGGGGREMGDQGHRTDLGSAESSWEIVSAEEGDEHKAERDEGTSSDDEIERIPSDSTVHLGEESSWRMWAQMKLINCLLMMVSMVSIHCFILRFTFAIILSLITSTQFLHRTSNLIFLTCVHIIGALLSEGLWIICIGISNLCFGWFLTVFEFGFGFVTRILRQGPRIMSLEGDSHDGAEGRGGGRKTGDQGHSTGSGPGIVSEGRSSTSNVLGKRIITRRRKQAVTSDQEKFPAIKADFIKDRKSAATGSNFFGKSLKSLSPGKED